MENQLKPKTEQLSKNWCINSLCYWCTKTMTVIYYRNVAKAVKKLIVRNFIMQKDNDQKHTVTQKRTSSGGKVKGFKLTKSISRASPSWAAFHLLNRTLKGEPPHQTHNYWKKLSYKPEKASQKTNATACDVSGSPARCTYCKQVIRHQILCTTHFKHCCSNTFGHLTSWLSAKGAMF